MKRSLATVVLAAAALATFGFVQRDYWPQMRFEGHGRHRAFKRIDNRGVRIKRVLSKDPCIEGKSWGHNPKGFWVDRGCVAIFEVNTLHHH